MNGRAGSTKDTYYVLSHPNQLFCVHCCGIAGTSAHLHAGVRRDLDGFLNESTTARRSKTPHGHLTVAPPSEVISIRGIDV